MNDSDLFRQRTYVGVDPTAGKKPFVYAAISHDLSLLNLSTGDMDYTLAFLAGQQNCCVAVCSPSKPNQGLMTQDDVRQRLIPPPKPGRWQNYRVAEYILRRHHIPIPPTCRREQDCPRWMQKGFIFYRRLVQLGFVPYSVNNSPLQFLEVYPHAAYTILLGQNPLPKHTLEGRIQRQLLLHELDINVPDPMRLFEEITRYKLLRGNFPLDNVFSPVELDAIIAAYCAWLAVNKPASTSLIGDSREGQILIPAVELKSHY